MVSLDDFLLDSWGHCGSVWVVGGEVLLLKDAFGVEVHAACANFIMDEIDKVQSFPRWRVHLLLLCVLCCSDAVRWTVGRCKCWRLVWVSVGRDMGVCSRRCFRWWID